MRISGLVVVAILFLGFLSIQIFDGYSSHTIQSKDRLRQRVAPVLNNPLAIRSTPVLIANSVRPSQQQSTDKKYQSSQCTNITIPRKTVIIEDDSMLEGETKLVSKGKDGYYTKCAPDSSGKTPSRHGARVEPTNDIVRRGTMPHSKYSKVGQCVQNLMLQSISRQQAEHMCNSVYHR